MCRFNNGVSDLRGTFIEADQHVFISARVAKVEEVAPGDSELIH